jgi:hypothetical protein
MHFARLFAPLRAKGISGLGFDRTVVRSDRRAADDDKRRLIKGKMGRERMKAKTRSELETERNIRIWGLV